MARRDFFRSAKHVVHPDAPVVGVSWRAAVAYCEWRTSQDGHPWRLPTEVEWEKAARGVDARYYPWGDRFDLTFARLRAGVDLPQFAGTCDAQTLDISPYGLRGMAGNVREWCLDPFEVDEPASSGSRIAHLPDPAPANALRAVRGGSWSQPPAQARCAARAGCRLDQGYFDVGFRLVRPLTSD